ncbi:MAG: gliding motility-associated C-terminal domain-containing protein, partial [Flavobacteriales bacterium]
NTVGLQKIYYQSDGRCKVKDSIEITVLPKLKVEFLSSDTSVCEKGKDLDLPLSLASSSGGTWWCNNANLLQQNVFKTAQAQWGKYTVKYSVSSPLSQCSAEDSVNIEVRPQPQAKISANQWSGCAPLTVNLSDTSGISAINRVWIISDPMGGKDARTDSSFDYIFSQPGCYQVQLQNTFLHGCTDTAYLANAICIEKTPEAQFSSAPQEANILMPNYQFDNKSSDYLSLIWDFQQGNPTTSFAEEVLVTFPAVKDDSIAVRLIASNLYCRDTLVKFISIKDISSLFMANAFSPNGDGLNDLFSPIAHNISAKNFEFMVFNRWGEMIFSTQSPSENWNGKRNNNLEDAPIDIYVWKLKFKEENVVKEMVGSVSLLR